MSDRALVTIELGHSLLVAKHDARLQALVLHTSREAVLVIPLPNVPLEQLQRVGSAAILSEFPDARIFPTRRTAHEPVKTDG